MLFKTFSLNRVVPIAALAAVLATAIVVTPSLAGSFLSSQKAARLYVTHKEAAGFLKKQPARNTYLTKKAAKGTYASADAVPVAAASASNAVFGPVSSTTAVDVPTSGTSFVTEQTGLVKLTFSGVSQCTGDTDDVPCQVQILIDGLNIGKVTLDNTGAPPAVHSFTVVSVVTPGEHVASVQYAGSADASVGFKLTSWTLFTEAYPGQ